MIWITAGLIRHEMRQIQTHVPNRYRVASHLFCMLCQFLCFLCNITALFLQANSLSIRGKGLG